MSSSAVLTSVRHLRGLLAAQRGQDESDEQLLHAFLSRRDENAFAVLVRRHGPMVLHVCRRALCHQQDAEDVFQATFLVLARNAASLRKKTALASFLHGTAYRMAMKAKQAAARRRKHEGQAPTRPPADPTDELSWREVRTLLDEEIARLPEIYRSAFVLCCLENLSRTEAARRLGLKERTVLSRLAEARKRLQQRLSRRGVELTALLAASVLTTGTASALPAVLLTKAIGGTVSPAVAALADSVSTILSLGKAKLAAVFLLAASVLSGAGLWAYRDPIAHAGAPPTQAAEPPADKASSKTAVPPQREAAKTVEIQGRVLDPDGKPVAGARVYVDPQTPNEKPMDSATTRKDGRFSLTLARSRLVDQETKFPLRRVRILATAKGWGLDWLDVPLDDAGKEATLHLVKDDVPIQGRILSLEGKPLAGVKVSVKGIEAFPKGDLSRALAVRRKTKQISDSTEVRVLWYLHHAPVPSLTATTGADGCFRLDGLGRERIVTMNVEGPGIQYSRIDAMTRRAESVRDSYHNLLYGATFEYLAKPSRLIRGMVREKGTGKPLAGIRVHEIGLTGFVSDEVSTDEQGRYELRGCPKGDRYGLSAHAIHGEPFLLSSIGIKDTAGLGPLTADLEMVRGIPCEGKVLDDETGQPVPGDIGYYPLYPNPNVTSNIGLGNVLRGSRVGSYAPFSQAAIQADGSFRCAVLPGGGCLVFRARETNRYVLACVDPSTAKVRGDKRVLLAMNGEDDMVFGLHQEQFQAIRLIEPAKDTKKVSEVIRVAVARSAIGTVLDADGKPLRGVRVRGLKRWEWNTLETEKFTVYGVNPLRPRQLYFVHEAKHLIGSVEVKGTETKPLTVRLQPWAAVRGRLVDAEGRPVCHARLHGNEFLPEDGRTDDQGRFRLDGLIPALRYDLTYEKGKPSMSGTLLEGFIGKPGEVRDLGDVRGKPFRQE
ncbi:MAG TPA: sigma-70 family RNA polymerase sigma factor [Gemmataceae bacterium]